MPAASWWDVPAVEYHADNEKIGSSMAKLFRRSPREFYLRHVVRRLPPTQPAAPMQFGSLSHLALLEPDRLHGAIALPPATWNLHSPADRAAKRAWIESLPSDVLPTTDVDLGRALALSCALRADPWIAGVLARSHTCEAAATWECAHSGLPRKVMFDLVTEDNDRPILLELKTLEEYPDRFIANAIRYGYAHQAAWYEEAAAELGYEDAQHVTIAVRTEPPWDHLLYEYAPESLALARKNNTAAMLGIAEALATGIWEHPKAGRINTLSMPSYAFS